MDIRRPDDDTNCLTCKPGYTFKDAGWSDCTGTCQTTTAQDIAAIHSSDLGANPKYVAAEINFTEWTYTNATIPRYLKKPVALDKATGLFCRELDPALQPTAAGSGADPPLLVMTTTIGHLQSMDSNKQMLQQAAATTWEVLQPEVQTLVAVDAEHMDAPGHQLPRIVCPANPAGTPYASGLFKHAAEKAKRVGARFAGFTNGDIGYDATLIDVLTGVAHDIDRGLLNPNVLVIGKRLNVANAVEDAVTFSMLGQQSAIEDRLKKSAPAPGSKEWRKRRSDVADAILRISHKAKNTWMSSLAEDFFFFTPDTFNWDKLPHYVIGRVGWDSFVTQWALDSGVEVIDASQYLHAAHLTGADGNNAGWNTKRPDKSWNYCALHASCDSGEAHWTPFCQSCFRCKLGGTHQAGWRSAPRHPRGADGKDTAAGEKEATLGPDVPTVVRHQYNPTGDEKAETEASTLHRTKHVLWWFGVPNETAPAFIEAVREQIPNCEENGNCCSIRGASAVEYELGQRWQVRGEWPVDGTENATSLNTLWVVPP